MEGFPRGSKDLYLRGWESRVGHSVSSLLFDHRNPEPLIQTLETRRGGLKTNSTTCQSFCHSIFAHVEPVQIQEFHAPKVRETRDLLVTIDVLSTGFVIHMSPSFFSIHTDYSVRSTPYPRSFPLSICPCSCSCRLAFSHFVLNNPFPWFWFSLSVRCAVPTGYTNT
jgi:hypothetical protein